MGDVRLPMDQAAAPQAKRERLRLKNAKYRLEHLDYFRDKQREYRAQNPEKFNKIAREYRKKNPDMVRGSNLKKKYGITLEQFNELFDAQGRVCAICKGESHTGLNWHVDHCHGSMKIRGILCNNCNLMIGHARDNVKILLAAVEYLK